VKIDTHAHAFPSPELYAQSLPEPARAATGATASALSRAARAIPPLPLPPLFDVERLASFRKRRPLLLAQASELLMGVAMLPQIALRAGLDDLLASMDRYALTHTVVIAGWPAAPNEWLLDTAPDYGGRIIPVAHPPQLPAEASQDDCEVAFDMLAEAGARGFKIHLNMDGLPVECAVYRALFEIARARDLFVIIHTGRFNTIAYKNQQPVAPEMFARYFEDYPEVRVCLAHMNRDEPAEALSAVTRFENLFVDTSWQPADSIADAIAQVGAERVLLGSDWPLLHADLQGECIRLLERAASDEEIEAITGSSAARFVGLEA